MSHRRDVRSKRQDRPALLALADGTVFRGRAFGAERESEGEVVFNTAITGYQEVVTDPSYHGQIVAMTASQMGNVGWNRQDFESSRPRCQGLVVRELASVASNWRSEGSLGDLLESFDVPGIEGIDTRALTQRLRDQGAMTGVMTTNLDADEAVAKARRAPTLDGRDLCREVTCADPYEWSPTPWQAPPGYLPRPLAREARFHVVAYDFGIKRTILDRLAERGCRVTVVPAHTEAREALALRPDGLFLSNGPGDPAALPYAVATTRELLASKRPLFGICLGHQILGLALGGRTYKLKFGHHGANQPVLDLSTGKVEITSQNHGYAVDTGSLRGIAHLSHVNLNDRTVEGMYLEGLPVFSVQYHPEASPGPHDASYLFDRFVRFMERR